MRYVWIISFLEQDFVWHGHPYLCLFFYSHFDMLTRGQSYFRWPSVEQSEIATHFSTIEKLLKFPKILMNFEIFATNLNDWTHHLKFGLWLRFFKKKISEHITKHIVICPFLKGEGFR